jgi:glycyl-tRNA synthetase beta subunit
LSAFSAFAGLLSKSDLVTQMVGELPDLQGTMGRQYSLRDGEAPEVAAAIYEQCHSYSSGPSLQHQSHGALRAPLAVGFKRVVNIVRKEAETGATLGDVDPDALVAEEEKALWEAYKDAAGDLEVALGNRDWDAACHILIGLKSPVDDFFDDVMVNAQDEALRKNRLALLDDL